jgi:hypothetical protein
MNKSKIKRLCELVLLRHRAPSIKDTNEKQQLAREILNDLSK